MIGLGLALTLAGRSAAAAAFTPAALFAGGYTGDWWDASDTNTVYSDAGGTTLITRGADTTAASWRGKVNSTLIAAGGAATHPIYKSANDTILFDGVDDYLISAGNVMTPYPLSIVAIVDKTLYGSGIYGAGAISASATDHVSIKVVQAPVNTVFADRGAANQTSGFISMPTYTGALAAAFFRGTTTTDARLLYNEGTEASISAAANNTHAAGRFILGAGRHAAGVPAVFGSSRLRASIVINKALSVDECNSLRTYYGIA